MTGEIVTVVRDTPGGVDQYGDPLPAEQESRPIPGCIVYPGAQTADTEPVVLGRTPVVSDWVVLMPTGTDVRHTDELVIRGHRCKVVGRPFDWSHPWSGWQPGIQVRANSQEG